MRPNRPVKHCDATDRDDDGDDDAAAAATDDAAPVHVDGRIERQWTQRQQQQRLP